MLKIYNSLSKTEEEFKPIKDGEVSMYSCGPTVYNYPHIGNYRAFLFNDILKRSLVFLGYKVNHIMNITDVDDKTIRDSQIAGKTLKEFTKFYTDEFNRELELLNILPVDKQVLATEHIDGMIEMIETLKEKGFAYAGEDGSTYFDISKFSEYGALSGVDLSQAKNQVSRIAADEYTKDNPQDFALWKAWSKEDGENFWTPESLGKGRPGWHIECSAMSTKYLGNHFDIHTGGVDLAFPHHENEIAQSVCCTGENFANFWLHNEHILVDYKKMSKSAGNFYRLSDLKTKGYDALDYRYFILSANYRTKTNLTWKALDAAKSARHKILAFTKDNFGKVGSVSEDYKSKFIENIEDDLNMPKALATLHETMKDKNLSNEDKYTTILEFDKVLGLNLEKLSKKEEIPQNILDLVEERKKVREEKDWETSDKLRAEILELGYEITDQGSDTSIYKIMN